MLLANSPAPVRVCWWRWHPAGVPAGRSIKEGGMSLQPQAVYVVPEETARVARAAFPKGNAYLRMHDELGRLYADQDFAALFPTPGQPALAPAQLALVTLLQFVEGLSDRQAAEAVRARIDWKYALRLELEDLGFDFVRHVTWQSIADAIGT